MRILLCGLLAFTVAVLPVRGWTQEEEEDDEGNDSYEQSTEDSSDETTAESTNQPSRNTTDPSVELFWPLLNGGREPTESEGDYSDSDRAAALGISTLSLALVVVAIVAIASSGPDKPVIVTPSEPPPTLQELRASAWLSENDEQLRVDIARGQGPTLDDLAAAFALRPERRPAFGLALRSRRTVLLAVLDAQPARKADHVRGFLREVGTTMRENESTRSDWENWRITYGVAVPAP